MRAKKLGWITVFGCIVILGDGLCSYALGNQAIASPSSNHPGANQPDIEYRLAQTPDSTPDPGCRQTNTTTGVYAQPNLDSTSRGILTAAQTVRLEVLGTGTGWARISQPIVGWIEAKYLTPTVGCDGLESATPNASTSASTASATSTNNTSSEATSRESDTSIRQRMLAAADARRRGRTLAQEQAAATGRSQTTTTAANSFPQPNSSQPNSQSNPRSLLPNTSQPAQRRLPNRPTNIAEATSVTCDVLPAYGLIVRSEPSVVGDTYIDTIPRGTYQFRFTRNTQTDPTAEGLRRWVYITAPVEGWISLGFVGKEFNLGGRQCG